jgi:hypothetical protein
MDANEISAIAVRAAAAAVDLAALYLRADAAARSGDIEAARAYLKSAREHYERSTAATDAAVAEGGYDLGGEPPAEPSEPEQPA